MTVYTADPIPMKAVSGAQAFEIADTINKPRFVTRPVTLDFTWSPTTSEITMIGLDTVTVRTVDLFTPITFTAATSLPSHRYIVNYEWKFGDGTIIQTSLPSVVHEYTVPNYSGVRASLIITDDLGRTYSCGHQIYLFGSIFSPGGIIFGGSMIEHHTGTDVRSGALVLGGASNDHHTGTETRSGDVILGGTIIERPGVGLTGDVILGGSLVEHHTWSDHVTGNLLFHDGSVTGGVVMGGSLVEHYTGTETPTGTLKLSGVEPFSPSGNLILGGSLVEGYGHASVPTGNLILGGTNPYHSYGSLILGGHL